MLSMFWQMVRSIIFKLLHAYIDTYYIPAKMGKLNLRLRMSCHPQNICLFTYSPRKSGFTPMNIVAKSTGSFENLDGFHHSIFEQVLLFFHHSYYDYVVGVSAILFPGSQNTWATLLSKHRYVNAVFETSQSPMPQISSDLSEPLRTSTPFMSFEIREEFEPL